MNYSLLDNLCHKITDGSHQSPNATEEGYPMPSVKDMTDFGFDFTNVKRISKEDFQKLAGQGCKPEIGDVLIAKDGSVLKHIFNVTEEIECVVLSSIAILKTNREKILPEFLVYSLKNPIVYNNILSNYVSGSGVPRIVLKDFKKVKINVPSLETQKSIVSIINPIDEKILTNIKMNRSLEQLAQAIFKSWFVDFEAVHAKKEALKKGFSKELSERAASAVILGVCNPIEYVESFEEMEKALTLKLSKMSKLEQEEIVKIASLFPSKFVDKEDKIPEGFKKIPIYDLINVIGGGTPKRSDRSYWGGKIPWFTVKDVPSSGIAVFDTEEYITDLGLKKSSTKIQRVGTTIISARGTVGKLALVMEDMAMNQSCYGVEPKKGLGPVFNYFNLKEVVGILKKNAHGAVFDTITHDTFKTCEVTFAGFELAMKFESITEAMIKRIYQNQKENKTLDNLRDTLLPRLLAGEIDLSHLK